MKKNLSFQLAAGLIAATLAGLSALPAQAEGLYFGGSLGHPDWRDRVNGIEGGSNGVGGKLYGGYDVNSNFALEGGAMSLGHTDTNGGDAEAYGAFLDGVGKLPFAPGWSLLGRLGVAHARFDTSGGDDTGNGWKVGAGLEYELSNTTALRGEWERYRISVFDTHPNIDQYTVGLKVLF